MIAKMTESELYEEKAPWPDTFEDLADYIKTLVERPHDYGTSVYALSLSSVATFNYVAKALGMTGFQASYAELDFLRRTRGLEAGFRVIDYSLMLYPQYWDENGDLFRILLREEDTLETIAEEAKKLLETISEDSVVHPDVKAHWQQLAQKEIPSE